MSRNIPGLTLAYTAAGEVPARVLVKHGGHDGEAALATSASDAFLGVSADLARSAGQHVDVIRSGLTPVIYGAAITKGAPLTANASGYAIPAKARFRRDFRRSRRCRFHFRPARRAVIFN